MANKLFVGNLSWDTGAEGLKEAFSKFGDVTDAFVATDKYSGRSRGFGFVTFADADAAAKAKDEMHEQELDGRAINIDFAQERRED